MEGMLGYMVVGQKCGQQGRNLARPSVPEINGIGSHGKVDGGKDLAKVEGSREWTAGLAEAGRDSIILSLFEPKPREARAPAHQATQQFQQPAQGESFDDDIPF